MKTTAESHSLILLLFDMEYMNRLRKIQSNSILQKELKQLLFRIDQNLIYLLSYQLLNFINQNIIYFQASQSSAYENPP